MIQKSVRTKLDAQGPSQYVRQCFPISESFQILLTHKQCITLLPWIAVRIIER